MNRHDIEHFRNHMDRMLTQAEETDESAVRAKTKIQFYYPADSPYPKQAATGKRLLMEAVARSWRSLPVEILKAYADLCEQEWAHTECAVRDRAKK